MAVATKITIVENDTQTEWQRVVFERVEGDPSYVQWMLDGAPAAPLILDYTPIILPESWRDEYVGE